MKRLEDIVILPKKIFFCCLICIFTFPSIVAAKDEAGGAPGVFLRIGIDTKALAMGSAQVAIANDASAFYWNAAGLEYSTRTQLGGMYSIMSLDRHLNYAGFSLPISEFGTVGAGWISYGVGNIDGRDEMGNPTESFSSTESAYYLSYSKKLIGNKASSVRDGRYRRYSRNRSSSKGSTNFSLSIGASAKLLQYSLANVNANGYGFDVGALAKFANYFSVGINVQDLGSTLSWDTNLTENFPVLTRAGFAIGGFNHPFTLTFDTWFRKNTDPEFHVGGEFWLRYFSIRAGYNRDFVFGGAVRVPAGKAQLEIGYAFTSNQFSESGNHQSSLLIRF